MHDGEAQPRDDVRPYVVGDGRVAEGARQNLHVPRVTDDRVGPLVQELAPLGFVRLHFGDAGEDALGEVLPSLDGDGEAGADENDAHEEERQAHAEVRAHEHVTQYDEGPHGHDEEDRHHRHCGSDSQPPPEAYEGVDEEPPREARRKPGDQENAQYVAKGVHGATIFRMA